MFQETHYSWLVLVIHVFSTLKIWCLIASSVMWISVVGWRESVGVASDERGGVAPKRGSGTFKVHVLHAYTYRSGGLRQWERGERRERWTSGLMLCHTERERESGRGREERGERERWTTATNVCMWWWLSVCMYVCVHTYPHLLVYVVSCV